MAKLEEVARAIVGKGWDRMHPTERAAWLANARTAIEALRKPSEAMEIAGHEVLVDSWRRSAETVWAAMIDAALSEEG